jgi:ribose-phosphate pyrophosphokinase
MGRGARSVRAMVTHALLTDDALRKIADSPLTEVLVTDTVPVPVTPQVRTVSVAPLFAEAIRSIYEETSISRLFG